MNQKEVIGREVNRLLYEADLERTSVQYDSQGRNLTQLRRFFNALDERIVDRNIALANPHHPESRGYLQPSVTRAVMHDIFSYSGYEEIATLRDQSTQNIEFSRMLDEALSEGPAVVIDIGTYTGVRTREIMSMLKNKDNITQLIGLDKNPIVNSAFDNYTEVPAVAVQANAFEAIHSLHGKGLKKIILAPENVLVNNCEVGGEVEGVIHRELDILLENGDTTICEVTHTRNPDYFGDGVEDIFQRYFEESGLKSIVGGKLHAGRNYGRNPDSRLTSIRDINPVFEFEGKKYDLRIPTSYRRHFAHLDHISQNLQYEYAMPHIHIGVSDTIPKQEHFSHLIKFLVHNVVAKKESDIVEVNDKTVMKLEKDEDFRVNDEQLARELTAYYYTGIENRRRAPLFNNLTCVMVGSGYYPAHYNRYLYETDPMIVQDESCPASCPDPRTGLNQGVMSDATKHYLMERVRSNDHWVQDNMKPYISNWTRGIGEEVSFNINEHLSPREIYEAMYGPGDRMLDEEVADVLIEKAIKIASGL